jgi:hypothetical protein
MVAQKRTLHPINPAANYTPDSLWEKAEEYFRWNRAHPLEEEKAYSTGKSVIVSKMRALTMAGFRAFAGMSQPEFEAYSKSPDYKASMSRIKDVMYAQKFEAAAAGILETPVITRELNRYDQEAAVQASKGITIQVTDDGSKEQVDGLKKMMISKKPKNNN